MSDISYAVTTSSSVDEIWRKIAGKLYDGINFTAEEASWMEEATDARLAPSTREVLVPVNLTLGGGVASIAEGAKEAIPGTPAANEISLALCQFNKRFTISELVRIIDEAGGGANATQIESQFKFSARHALVAMTNTLADYWYGKSTAVLALTNTNLNATSQVITLTAGYGETWITDPAYLARKFQASPTAGIGDRVAFYDGGTRIANAVGTVYARSTSGGTITVVFDGSAPGLSTDSLAIVKANSVDNTTDDYNRGLVGLLDALLSTSVHGLTTSTENWNVAYSDTTGSRMNGMRLRHGLDEIENLGPGKADRVLLSQGVRRDLIAQYQSQVRFSDSSAMPIDGDLKDKGVKYLSTKRTPPGFACAWDSSGFQRFFGKPALEGQLNGLSYSDLKKMEDKSGYLASANYVGNLVVKARRGFAYWTGLTEQ